jgi:hypothetical protein
MRTPAELKSLVKASLVEGELPLRVPPGPAQLAELSSLQEALRAETAAADLSTWDKRQVLILRVQAPSPDGVWRYGGSASLNVYFTGDALQVSQGYRTEGAPLTGLPQLRRLVAAVYERLVQQRRREQRRDKLRKLKQRAIEAQVEVLAARHGFAYAIEPMATKVTLVVRLDAHNGISIDLPHKRAEEVLADLPKLLDNLRALYRTGVRFKVISTRYVRDFREPRPA